MKSNEQSPVDAYFRQHEAEIPVTFDVQHWNQLAALLDAAETPDAPGGTIKPVSPRKTRFRGGKGWWASGIWILVVMTAFWMTWQTAGNNAAENGSPRYPTAPTPADVQSVAPVQEKEWSKPVTGNVAEPASGLIPEADAELPAGMDKASGRQTQEPPFAGSKESSADSIVTRTFPGAPSDTAVQETKPVKKKKHLFW